VSSVRAGDDLGFKPCSLRWQLGENIVRTGGARFAWWAPRSARWLVILIPGMFWAGALMVIEALSFVPGLAPPDPNSWRVGLGIPAVIVLAVLLAFGRRASERRFQQWQLVMWILSALVNFTILMLTPARTAVLVDLLATTLAAGLYFLPRVVVWQMLLLTTIALSTLVFGAPGVNAGPSFAWLVVYLPVMWAVSFVVSQCRFGLNRGFLEVEQQASTDPLTGLANLRRLREAVDEGFEADGARGGGGLLLIDIDNFKVANTLHGHAGGDRALRAIADALLDTALQDHVVARVGGDEIAVLVPAGSEAELRRFARVYRRAVRSANSRLDLPGLYLDACVGVAMRPRDGVALADLLAAADHSLYEAKERMARRMLAAAAAAGPAGPSRLAAAAAVPPVVVEIPDALPESLVAQDEPVDRWPVYARRIGGSIAGAFAVGLVAVLVSHTGGEKLIVAAAICVAGIVAGAAAALLTPSRRVLGNPLVEITCAVALVALIAMTGGAGSPLLIGSFALALLIYTGAERRPLWWRIALPEAVLLSALTYQSVFSGAGAAPRGALFVATIAVAAGLSVALYLTERLADRIVEDASRDARHDPLTGLLNRRAFEERLERHLARGQEIALVMIDLDNFGAVNEVHGHQTGDALLCDIASALRAVVRDGDCLARVGGDEFAAILVGVGPAVARPLAECFVATVADYTANAADGTIACITASAGFALYPRHAGTGEDLLARADESLMRVKHGGERMLVAADRVAMAG
jgi:diguanylate cyclase (GGDEF)-like protein